MNDTPSQIDDWEEEKFFAGKHREESVCVGIDSKGDLGICDHNDYSVIIKREATQTLAEHILELSSKGQNRNPDHLTRKEVCALMGRNRLEEIPVKFRPLPLHWNETLFHRQVVQACIDAANADLMRKIGVA